MLYQNKEITQYFNDETMHVLDYDFEYLPGYLDAAKFPEYTNKVEDLKPNSFLMIFVYAFSFFLSFFFFCRFGDSSTLIHLKLRVSSNSEMLNQALLWHSNSRLCLFQESSDIKLVNHSTSMTLEVFLVFLIITC